MSYKVSVIIPVYNSEEFLSDCIQSVLNQSYSNLEVILINDGSTDNSLKICQDYGKKDSRIIIINQENKGQSAARNKGLHIASGNYISFIDSDDTISLDLYYENIKILKEKTDIEVIQFPVYKNYGLENSKIIIKKPELITSKKIIFTKWLEEDVITWIVCDKIFKKEIFKNLSFEEGMIYEDNYLLTNVLNRIKQLYISKRGIYYYHYRLNSTTTSIHSLKKDLDTQKVSLNILDKLTQIENSNKSKAIILSRIFYVYQSLIINHQYKLELNELFINEFKKISILEFVKSKLPNRQKIKLLIVKTIGINYFIENKKKEYIKQ